MRRAFQLPIAACAVVLAAGIPASAQSASGAKYVAPRASDGKADLQGIWQVRNTAAGSLEAHGASLGIQAGNSVVVDPPDGMIPYQPWAAEKRADNYKHRATADPLNKCYLPGVPRVTYVPFPFQIFQTPKFVAIASEYDHATRTIRVDGSKHLEDIDFWMGDSRGRWEGDTLVVETTDFNDQTWFDSAGDFHSAALKLTERFSRTGLNTLLYEVTFEDSKVFTRPWKISMPLYRHDEKNFQLYEYECPIYLDEAAKERK